MSTSEILDQLPNLPAEELDTIFYRAAALRQHAIAASPELLAAIDEADASFATEGGKPIEEVEGGIKSWPIK